jgi:predicted PurR-regulated permease PerM
LQYELEHKRANVSARNRKSEGNMSNDASSDLTGQFLRNTTAATLHIGALVAMVVWCFDIVRPFISIIVWAVILAIALFPLYRKCLKAMGGRVKSAATLVTLFMVLLLVVPTIMLTGVLVSNIETAVQKAQHGELHIPAPRSEVAEIPLVGKSLDKTWRLASTNLAAVVKQFSPQIKIIGSWLLSVVTGTGIGFFKFIVSIIIAGFLMANSEAAHQFAHNFARRLSSEGGSRLLDLAHATIKNVARGILGVAFVQAVLAGMGMLVAGVPGAGLWALLCLIMAVIQLGAGPVMIGATIYMWSEAATLPALLFTVWAVGVTLIDNVLKPLWMSRGLDVPIVVILVGTIGGMLATGVVGLFVGAVGLAVGYKLLMAWLQAGVEPATV